MSSLVALVLKDIVLELRRKESVISMMMFGLLVVVILTLAFEPAGAERALIAPGALWVALTFVMKINRPTEAS